MAADEQQQPELPREEDDSLAQNIALSLELHALLAASPAASSSLVEKVKDLLDRGAAAWVQDEQGWSALHHAAGIALLLPVGRWWELKEAT